MEIIKKHPYISIGALLASVAVVFYVSAGSGTSAVATSGVDPNEIAAATALQQSQMQQQAQIAGVNASLQANQDNNATSIALADIQSKYGYDVASLASTVQLANINATAQTTALQSTLQEQATEAAINGQVQEAAISSNTTIMTTQSVASALVQESAYNAETAQAAISAASSCHGLGCLF